MRRTFSEAPVAQLEPARRWVEPLVAVSDPGLWSPRASGSWPLRTPYSDNRFRNVV